MKDKRIKVCVNRSCSRSMIEGKRKGAEFPATDRFCPQCGHELVLACTKCHGHLEDSPTYERVCAGCKAKAEDRRGTLADGAKKVAGAIPVVVGVVYATAKKAPKIAKEVVNILKH